MAIYGHPDVLRNATHLQVNQEMISTFLTQFSTFLIYVTVHNRDLPHFSTLMGQLSNNFQVLMSHKTRYSVPQKSFMSKQCKHDNFVTLVNILDTLFCS